MSVAVKIETNANSPLFCYHRLGFLFLAFRKLLLGEIFLEEFMQIGDVESARKIYDSKAINSVGFLEKVGL